ncbi:MAG: hypothetical protein CR967_02780 [Proteobacteria bacterium]|nr:MAG: hypothetical protein CR967_02780 [Pseudomonadota bacterium]
MNLYDEINSFFSSFDMYKTNLQDKINNEQKRLNKKKLEEDTIWKNAIDELTISSINNYLELYPNGMYRNFALSAINDIQAWKDVYSSSQALEYIKYFPNGIFINDAKEYIEKTQKNEKIRELCLWLKENNVYVVKNDNYDIKDYEIEHYKEVEKITELHFRYGRKVKLKIPHSINLLINLNIINIGFDYTVDELPPEIGDLKHLKKLSIKGDNLILPPEIGNLTDLEELEIRGCNVFPETIGNLSRLQSLNIAMSYSSEPQNPIQLPTSIGNLKNLKYLEITHRIEVLPVSIGNLEKLEFLRVCSGCLKEFPDIRNLKRLQKLALTAARKITSIPNWFVELENIKSLDLSCTGITRFPPNFNFSQYHSIQVDMANVGVVNKLRSLFGI